jgi:hypothetical protein
VSEPPGSGGGAVTPPAPQLINELVEAADERRIAIAALRATQRPKFAPSGAIEAMQHGPSSG